MSKYQAKLCGFKDDRGLRCTRYVEHTGPHSFSKPTAEAYTKDTLDTVVSALSDSALIPKDRARLTAQATALIKILDKIKKDRRAAALKAKETRERRKKESGSMAAVVDSVDFEAQLKSTKGR